MKRIQLNNPLHRGKRGLVVGIVNESSIAGAWAESFAVAGPRLAFAYLSAKASAVCSRFPITRELEIV